MTERTDFISVGEMAVGFNKVINIPVSSYIKELNTTTFDLDLLSET